MWNLSQLSPGRRQLAHPDPVPCLGVLRRPRSSPTRGDHGWFVDKVTQVVSGLGGHQSSWKSGICTKRGVWGGWLPAALPPLSSQNPSLQAKRNIPLWKNLARPRKRSQRIGDLQCNSPASSSSTLGRSMSTELQVPLATYNRLAKATYFKRGPSNQRQETQTTEEPSAERQSQATVTCHEHRPTESPVLHAMNQEWDAFKEPVAHTNPRIHTH